MNVYLAVTVSCIAASVLAAWWVLKAFGGYSVFNLIAANLSLLVFTSCAVWSFVGQVMRIDSAHLHTITNTTEHTLVVKWTRPHWFSKDERLGKALEPGESVETGNSVINNVRLFDENGDIVEFSGITNAEDIVKCGGGRCNCLGLNEDTKETDGYREIEQYPNAMDALVKSRRHFGVTEQLLRNGPDVYERLEVFGPTKFRYHLKRGLFGRTQTITVQF